MTRNAWKWIGPSLIAIVAVFIVVSYIYDRRVQREVVGHMPEPSDVPGVSVYGATLTASEEGKHFMRAWEAATRQLKGPQYDLEIKLNDAAFFKALAEVEGRDARDADARYRAYQTRYHFDQKVVFTVEMHGPKGGLFGVEPGRVAMLRLDSGEEYEPESWSESHQSTERHRVGVLTFAKPDGLAVLAPDTKIVELVWRDPANHAEGRVQWTLVQKTKNREGTDAPGTSDAP